MKKQQKLAMGCELKKPKLTTWTCEFYSLRYLTNMYSVSELSSKLISFTLMCLTQWEGSNKIREASGRSSDIQWMHFWILLCFGNLVQSS